jgi:predicted nuclease of predicted toxin-antitoxin system
MSKFLIDANRPRRLKFWQEDECEFVPDPQWPDHLVWQYAKDNQLIIVTKDTDVEKLALTVGSPIIYLPVGSSAVAPRIVRAIGLVMAHRPRG